MVKQRQWRPISERKEKKKYWYIAFLAFIVIGLSSSFAFFGFGSAPSERYNDIKFEFFGTYWAANIDGVQAAFTHPPSAVEFIEVNGPLLQVIGGKLQIDATSSINDTNAGAIAQAQYEMGLTLNNYGVFIRPGFTHNQSGFPTITCNDATPFVPVIEFSTANETSISTVNNCISVQAPTGLEMVMAKDRILYTLLGVMQ